MSNDTSVFPVALLENAVTRPIAEHYFNPEAGSGNEESVMSKGIESLTRQEMTFLRLMA
jgi:hypothetical protein